MRKPKTSENKAKDIETPKKKRIDISDKAKATIRTMQSNLNIYIQALFDEKGCDGKAQLDMKTMQIIVEDK